MDNKFRNPVAFLIVFYTACLVMDGPIHGSDKRSSIDLPRILEKTAEYCERLDKAALHFVCNEEIEELIYRGRVYTRYTYVYDYQLIRKDDKIEERRVLLEENGGPKNEENADLKTKRFRHEYVVFGPIGLLEESRQRLHDYAIMKEEKYRGDRCYVIEVTPKPEIKTGGLFGKAWVRQSDCSIMKIQWNQQSMGNIDKIREIADSVRARARITFTSEYAFEKNGIRFPSRYAVKEEYLRRTRMKTSETTTTYNDYRFFIVETEVKIK